MFPWPPWTSSTCPPSLTLGPRPPLVTGLAWQEPLDDPKPYSYLWVLRSGLESLAVASLFSLSFSQRKIDSVEGPCYEGLEYVNCKFVHDLTGKRNDTIISLLLK